MRDKFLHKNVFFLLNYNPMVGFALWRRFLGVLPHFLMWKPHCYYFQNFIRQKLGKDEIIQRHRPFGLDTLWVFGTVGHFDFQRQARENKNFHWSFEELAYGDPHTSWKEVRHSSQRIQWDSPCLILRCVQHTMDGQNQLWGYVAVFPGGQCHSLHCLSA